MAVEKGPTVGSMTSDQKVTRESVMALVDKIQSENTEEIKQAVIELRLLSKWEMNNRILIGEAGGIPLLVSLLTSTNSKIQENAVTALLNLSIYPYHRMAIVNTTGALESMAEVLRTGETWESKENCAALLSSLLIVEEHRDVIGKNSLILEGLRDLLNHGRVLGKKDALRAIFHLALLPENGSRIAMADIIPILQALMGSPRPGLIEDTLSVLAKLAACREGMDALKDQYSISLIVEYLQHGSPLAKENAASLLLALCKTGGIIVEAELRKHQTAVFGSLCTLRAIGSPRGKGKANDLMKVMRVSQSFSNASKSMSPSSSNDCRSTKSV